MKRIYWLDLFEKGNIALAARPKGNDCLEEEIKSLASQNINMVVSLLEKSEIKELSLEKEQEFCEKYAIEFINFPIVDRQIPESKIQFLKLIQGIIEALEQNKNILIHCRMGIFKL